MEINLEMMAGPKLLLWANPLSKVKMTRLSTNYPKIKIDINMHMTNCKSRKFPRIHTCMDPWDSQRWYSTWLIHKTHS
jgi:hypothetical protein